jgi:hypothetical protein
MRWEDGKKVKGIRHKLVSWKVGKLVREKGKRHKAKVGKLESWKVSKLERW